MKVVCRTRPLNQRELDYGGNICVEFNDERTITLKLTTVFFQNFLNHQPQNEIEPHKFVFDKVFDQKSRQDDVYNFSAKPVVESVLEGFNGTVFAYGQTGSGKTHTMQGTSIDDVEGRGIIPRMVYTVFEVISNTPEYIEFTVKVGMVEIYMEKIRDLCCPDKSNLKVREDKTRGVYIEDVTETYVTNENDVFDLMKLGNSNRAISATQMNEGSSRSHMLFMMSIHQNNTHEMSAKTGKLYLVDLAGSEKIAKTGAAGQTLEEAKKINKSLSSLGNVINALTDGKGHHHIPYRDSKLTRVLQESLGGNARTTLIITCSPSTFNDAETLSTLRFGQRAKSIKNTPKINREFTVAELRALLEKAEQNIADKDTRIKFLENVLKEHKLPIPTETEILPKVIQEIIPPEEKIEDITIDEESIDNEDSQEKEDVQIIPNKLPSLETYCSNDEQSRIAILESELESERNSVKSQAERINQLKKEYQLNCNKLATTEKENEALIHRIATMTMKQQELEETIIERENKLGNMGQLYESAVLEIEELKKNLDQANRQSQNVQKISEATSPIKQQKGSGSKISKEVSPKLDEIALGLISELSNAFGISDQEKLKKITLNYMGRVKSEIYDNLPYGQSPNKNELNQENSTLSSELAAKQDAYLALRSQYDKLSKEYDDAVRNEVPNFEMIKNKIINEALLKERARSDLEKANLLKDLQNRIQKVVQLEEELDNERDKRKEVESCLSEGEKALKSKVLLLQQTLEQLTNKYHQLLFQRSITKNEDKTQEIKLQKKTEQIIGLERELKKTLELANEYKMRFEILLSTGIGSLNDSGKKKTIQFEESKSQDPLNVRLGHANQKIVKPIKGGGSIIISRKNKIIRQKNRTFQIKFR